MDKIIPYLAALALARVKGQVVLRYLRATIAGHAVRVSHRPSHLHRKKKNSIYYFLNIFNNFFFKKNQGLLLRPPSLKGRGRGAKGEELSLSLATAGDGQRRSWRAEGPFPLSLKKGKQEKAPISYLSVSTDPSSRPSFPPLLFPRSKP